MATFLSPALDQGATRDRLAVDLGDVLDALLERTAQSLLDRLEEHGLSPHQMRVLRELERAVLPTAREALAERTGLPAAALDASIATMRARALLTRAADEMLTLTSRGRAIARDIDRARRTDLEAFVAGLDPTARRRVEAAVHLLVGEPWARYTPPATAE